jgi:hypothetical protein
MLDGSCLCGQIVFTVNKPLSNMTHCHCSICRKVHGALFATYVEAAGVQYQHGQDQIRTYESSEGFARAFCRTCGSVLPESNKDGSCYLPAGLLNQDPEIRPEAHIFVESKSDYYDIQDELPQHTYYGDGDKSRVIDTAPVEAVPGKVTGGCICGDVRFAYTGEPTFVMNCHCSRCRKAKSAALATNAFVSEDQLQWISGAENIVNYDLPGAERFGHAFCGRCGCSLPRQAAGTGVFNIPVGSLDNAPGVDARGHIYVGSKAPWFDISDPRPRWDEVP